MLPSYSRPRSAAPGTQARFTAAILVLCALCTLELMFLRGKQLENRDLQTALESSSFKFSELQVSNDQDKLDLTKMISSLEAATTATTELEAKVQALQVGTALAIYSEQREEIQDDSDARTTNISMLKDDLENANNELKDALERAQYLDSQNLDLQKRVKEAEEEITSLKDESKDQGNPQMIVGHTEAAEGSMHDEQLQDPKKSQSPEVQESENADLLGREEESQDGNRDTLNETRDSVEGNTDPEALTQHGQTDDAGQTA